MREVNRPFKTDSDKQTITHKRTEIFAKAKEPCK